jgi:hypothetical protein
VWRGEGAASVCVEEEINERTQIEKRGKRLKEAEKKTRRDREFLTARSISSNVIKRDKRGWSVLKDRKKIKGDETAKIKDLLLG